MFEFKIIARCNETGARAGEFVTPHGVVKTPVFMPVGTQATVKAMTPRELEEIEAQIILGNTYHLYLRPGAEVVAQAGGLHRFMGWNRPILTDSGGFQVFSLARLNKVTDKEVLCQSHVDGSFHAMSPEWAMKVQRLLGSDIAMCFDQCIPYPSEQQEAEKALERTTLWARRSKEAHLQEASLQGANVTQALFGIVQGSTFDDLRLRSAQELAEIDFPGYGIGGLSVGEPHEDMYRILDLLNPALPKDKPRYLMGVGYPPNIVEAIARGIDMFDCVLPTRNGRNGTLFTSFGRVNIKGQKYERDFSPVDPACDCYLCRAFTRAYLRHLYQAGEILAARLCTWHNLRFTIRLAREAREAILKGEYPRFLARFRESFRDSRPDAQNGDAGGE
ncbi:MAG: tRNA guanosine(34) transglycosylase Tgt [Synergistaceae bacterium]|jgi:queuine tRNA-ribosyltransferase|nr:tRNA guanosine(34) transglycosylase Tgt [Synergistaceae bacterium]